MAPPPRSWGALTQGSRVQVLERWASHAYGRRRSRRDTPPFLFRASRVPLAGAELHRISTPSPSVVLSRILPSLALPISRSLVLSFAFSHAALPLWRSAVCGLARQPTGDAECSFLLWSHSAPALSVCLAVGPRLGRIDQQTRDGFACWFFCVCHLPLSRSLLGWLAACWPPPAQIHRRVAAAQKNSPQSQPSESEMAPYCNHTLQIRLFVLCLVCTAKALSVFLSGLWRAPRVLPVPPVSRASCEHHR